MDPALFFGGDKDMLPTGSSGEQRQPFNLRDRRDRRDDDDEGPPPSRADEDGGWRRGPRTQPNQPQQRLTQGNPDEEAGWRRGSRQDDRGPPMREDDRGNERRDDRQDDRRDFGGRREGGGGGLRSFDRDGGNDRAPFRRGGGFGSRDSRGSYDSERGSEFRRGGREDSYQPRRSGGRFDDRGDDRRGPSRDSDRGFDDRRGSGRFSDRRSDRFDNRSDRFRRDAPPSRFDRGGDDGPYRRTSRAPVRRSAPNADGDAAADKKDTVEAGDSADKKDTAEAEDSADKKDTAEAGDTGDSAEKNTDAPEGRPAPKSNRWSALERRGPPHRRREPRQSDSAGGDGPGFTPAAPVHSSRFAALDTSAKRAPTATEGEEPMPELKPAAPVNSSRFAALENSTRKPSTAPEDEEPMPDLKPAAPVNSSRFAALGNSTRRPGGAPEGEEEEPVDLTPAAPVHASRFSALDSSSSKPVDPEREREHFDLVPPAPVANSRFSNLRPESPPPAQRDERDAREYDDRDDRGIGGHRESRFGNERGFDEQRGGGGRFSNDRDFDDRRRDSRFTDDRDFDNRRGSRFDDRGRGGFDDRGRGGFDDRRSRFGTDRDRRDFDGPRGRFGDDRSDDRRRGRDSYNDDMRGDRREMGRDERPAHLRRFGRAGAGSREQASGQQGGRAGAGRASVSSAPVKKDMPRPLAKKKLIDHLKEYLKNPSKEMREEKAVELRNCGFPEQYRPDLVMWAISLSLDFDGVSQDRVAEILVELRVQIPAVVSSKNFADGLELCVGRLSDLENDCPAAKKIISDMAKKFMESKCWNEADGAADGKTFMSVFGLEKKEVTKEAVSENTLDEASTAFLATGKKGMELLKLYKTSYEAAGTIDPASLLFVVLNAHLPLNTACDWAKEEEYGVILEELIYEASAETQLNCFRRLISVLKTAEFPLDPEKKFKYVSEGLFHSLYDKDILPGEAFIAWSDDTTAYDGKMKVLIQVTKYLKWLKENEEEEDSSDDDED